MQALMSKQDTHGFVQINQSGLFNELHVPDKEILLLARAIFPRDIGSAGYTEFSYDMKKIFSMYDAWPDAEQMIRGMIHSHNNMGVFFSGTDNEQLRDGAASHTNFLSLIVNNKMEMVAEISTEGEVSKSMNILPKTDIQFTSTEPVKERVTFSNKCDIVKPQESTDLPAWFMSAYDNVVQENKVQRTFPYAQKPIQSSSEKDLFGDQLDDWGSYYKQVNPTWLRTANEVGAQRVHSYFRLLDEFVVSSIKQMKAEISVSMDPKTASTIHSEAIQGRKIDRNAFPVLGFKSASEDEVFKNICFQGDESYLKNPSWMTTAIRLTNFVNALCVLSNLNTRTAKELLHSIQANKLFEDVLTEFLVYEHIAALYVEDIQSEVALSKRVYSFIDFSNYYFFDELSINPHFKRSCEMAHMDANRFIENSNMETTTIIDVVN
jgi:hypothetical protein